ncbi:hypothetical protein GbCGDNIH1_8683 [Granulibacter bethesdensis CGDNIH1]|uniref:Uncharacterized protein n=1 Tax=Granulibacter bethesdensis (strain ATCC BAA-1260 / CGDNIH1) TaxID=391165 RepID=A0A286M384_GRABC|nr:hypothetical protein GbCGDNIH1_8683 [Granulibacter bethesdensis CGDNIH1]ASV62554.1 hypothetical protein GbCGDNIH1I4_8683 [Granulibacter bethesdensis]
MVAIGVFLSRTACFMRLSMHPGPLPMMISRPLHADSKRDYERWQRAT